MLDLEAELNEHQLQAVLDCDGPLLVLAGAGSGKTRVITFKIAHLVLDRDLRPWQILAVTFTNKAAAEMRERVHDILGGEAAEVWLGTFHSICLRVLRKYAELVQRTRSFVVYDEDDRDRLIKRVLKSINISKDVLDSRKVRYYIDDAKHRLRGPDHPELPVTGYIDSLCAKVYKGYEVAKKQANAFDFGDLIQRAVVLIRDNPPVLSELRYKWRYILVDEFQDTDHAQYRFIKLLAGDKKPRICVVGDDDQSIYRWRGADLKNILGFDKDFPGHDVGVVRLERNYRSTGNILAAASALIANNTTRHEKTLWTQEPDGEKLRCFQAETESGEARWVIRKALEARRDGVSLNEIAIFYRTHSQSRVFEDALRGQATPYRVVGGLKFYERKEVKDIMSYLRLVLNPRDTIAMLRVVNSPTRGIGQKTMERANEIAQAQDKPLFDGLMLLAQQPGGKRARRAIEEFGRLISTLRTISQNENDAFRVAEAVLSETGYLTRLQDEGTIESESRAANIEELMVSIEEWRGRATDRSLEAFLDHVSLLTSMDEGDAEQEAVTLMTVHAAKGLEFDTVFVSGLEEDVFPHFNSKDDDALEEERRLAYVAVTRGKKRVFLSWARSRRRFGRLDINPPSRFLGEIPENVKHYESEMGRAASRNPFGGTTNRSARLKSMSDADWSPPSQSRGGWAAKSASSSTPASQSSGISYDYSDSQVDSGDGGELIGRGVRHPRFGDGRVAQVDGKGPNARVTVQFPGFGTKKIIARFLELAD